MEDLERSLLFSSGPIEPSGGGRRPADQELVGLRNRDGNLFLSARPAHRQCDWRVVQRQTQPEMLGRELVPVTDRYRVED